MRERERFTEGFVERERRTDAARDLSDFERVREACAEVIALPVDEDLRLVHQASETRAVHDAVAIALPTRPQVVFLFVVAASARRGAVQRARREIASLAGLFRATIEELEATHPGAPPRAMALKDRDTPRNPHVFVRGNASNPGPEVPRQFLEIVAGPQRKPFAQGSGRLEMAQAITSTSPTATTNMSTMGLTSPTRSPLSATTLTPTPSLASG